MKRVLAGAGLVLGLAILATPSQAQTGTLRGTVVDTEGKGIADVMDAVAACLAAGVPRSEARRRDRAEWRLRALLTERFLRRVEQALLPAGPFEAVVSRIVARELDPHTAADAIIRGLSKA